MTATPRSIARAPTGWSATSFAASKLCFPIERKQHRDRIIEDLETYLADNTQAWILTFRGTYERKPARRVADRECAERHCCSAIQTTEPTR